MTEIPREAVEAGVQESLKLFGDEGIWISGSAHTIVPEVLEAAFPSLRESWEKERSDGIPPKWAGVDLARLREIYREEMTKELLSDEAEERGYSAFRAERNRLLDLHDNDIPDPNTATHLMVRAIIRAALNCTEENK